MGLKKILFLTLWIPLIWSDNDFEEQMRGRKQNPAHATLPKQRLRLPGGDRRKYGLTDLRGNSTDYAINHRLYGTDGNRRGGKSFTDLRDKLASRRYAESDGDLDEEGELANVTGGDATWTQDARSSNNDGVFCSFESVNGTSADTCFWRWNSSRSDYGNSFQVLNADELAGVNTSVEVKLTGPSEDADGNANGHFLYLAIDRGTGLMAIKSPLFSGLWEFCKFEMMLHQRRMHNASIRIVAEGTQGHSWILQESSGNNLETWTDVTFLLGKILQDIHIIIEIVPPTYVNMAEPLPHIAIDNIRMVDCFPEPPIQSGECQAGQIKCLIKNHNSCIKLQQVCDLVKDCDDSIDEQQNCDKIPYGGYCDFEENECGWKDVPDNILKWSRHTGPTPTQHTGPNYDHTCGPTSHHRLMLAPPLSPANKSITPCVGWYFYVNMNVSGPNKEHAKFASEAVMQSVIFNPPPRLHGEIGSRYYNSCMIRFYYQQNGKNYGSLSLSVIRITPRGNISTSLLFSTKDKGEQWYRASIFLPNITTRYFFEFRTRKGIRIYSDTAIDDFSMAPECFGLNIPPELLDEYNYYDPKLDEPSTVKHNAFVNKTVYKFTTCNNAGRYGPNQTMCDAAYANTSQRVTVLSEPPYAGVQAWEVINDGYYTIIAVGASGGLGSSWTGASLASTVMGLFELHKGETIYMAVGQKGGNACKKLHYSPECSVTQRKTNVTYFSKTHEVKNTIIQDGGGGGGGASYVFLLSDDGHPIPLLVAGGGGGIGVGVYHDENGTQHGQGLTETPPKDGYEYGAIGNIAGGGKGWLTSSTSLIGGEACSGKVANGGFGGGGGACRTGGGGGGWRGGDTDKGNNGGGGFSYIDSTRSIKGYLRVDNARHLDSGYVLIIPAIDGCGCDYRCVALNEYLSEVQCYCPAAWRTSEEDPYKCVHASTSWNRMQPYMVYVFGAVSIFGTAIIIVICLYLYTQYLDRCERTKRKKHIEEQEVQLRRLRGGPDTDGILTAYNPHYGCDNGMDLSQLTHLPREKIKLVKALGQGAFGEVFQGMYRSRDNDSTNLPVAIKTLPEMSTNQAESEFVMEAQIMSKFDHPNIVRLIGVCFDRHPRFIVLELLAGGDLKNFLRESRPKPERCSTLTMKDLVVCAIDVVKGCKYMEEKRFIHRDIAARNCLLTTKGPGRVVKIADFGMSRDIYRAEYYRKGGKALLPIKWMPPEAFMDGVFTAKTDVWSFGVLLWEVYSLGVMPYTGCSNKQVMDMVEGGGRLECPYGCPKDIYKLMTDTWNPNPELRPSFSELLERLLEMQKRPDVVDLPLPTPRIMVNDLCCDGVQRCMDNRCDYLEPLTPNKEDISDIVPTNNGSRCVHSGTPPASSPNSPNQPDSEYQPLVKASPEYGNVSSARAVQEHVGGINAVSLNMDITTCKSTDRLLSVTSGDEISPCLSDKPVLWETSFSIEKGPPVEKLISIDTPQQTPTTVNPPSTTFNTTTESTVQQIENSKSKPLTLDASQLEQNLNALKRNRGSVNLNKMNIQVPAYINVVTPKLSDVKTIKIDPKKAVITDLQSPDELNNGDNIPNGPDSGDSVVSSKTFHVPADVVDMNDSEISC